MRRILCLALSLVVIPFAFADTLTLDQAIGLARQRNGDIEAANNQLRSAKAQVSVARSAFLPNLSATGEWSSSSSRTYTGAFATAGRTSSTGTALGLDASYRILDNGARGNSLRAVQYDAAAAGETYRFTVRNTVFNVVTQFYESLRAQQLLTVSRAQEARTKQQFDFTTKREEVGAGPKKDILQAEADYLNAQTNVLLGENSLTNARANLAALIGWDDTSPMPALDDTMQAGPARGDLNIRALADWAIQRRPDLIAARGRISSAQASLANAKLNRGVQWALDVRGNRSFARNVSDSAALVLSATVPLFDGFSTRSLVKVQEENILAQMASLRQQERVVRAEVEAAAKAHQNNRLVLKSSQLALAAARQNYDVSVKAQGLGKFNILEIQSAQVSLATAESNFVSATYDTLISDIRLSLVLGEPLPGEDQTQ